MDVLYLSCLKTDENKTQFEMAEAAEVTEVTIRNRSRELKTQLGRELSNPIQLL
jgi:transcription initiation factor TFIIB